MRSFKSKVFNCLLRNRHLLQGKVHKEIFDFHTSIAGFRKLCEKGAGKYSKIPREITIKGQTIEGMKSEWLITRWRIGRFCKNLPMDPFLLLQLQSRHGPTLHAQVIHTGQKIKYHWLP
jgi:hypothetical protein